MMELSKNLTPNVITTHIGENPRYFPEKYKTYANECNSDLERSKKNEWPISQMDANMFCRILKQPRPT